MSKTIVFKPEIETKLKKLRIKTKFVKYWIANKWLFESYAKRHRKEANSYEKANNWSLFIICAFQWLLTEEGYDYWNKISKL